MKVRLGKYCLYLAVLLLCGCAYRTMIYAPETVSADDHVQGAGVFIYRDELQAQLTLYKSKNSVHLQLLFTKISSNAAFASDNFYIESSRGIFKPITSPKVYSRIGDPNPVNSLAIQEHKILVVEFGEDVQSLDSFKLYIPPIITSSGRQIPNLDTIIFKKKRVWRAISPL